MAQNPGGDLPRKLGTSGASDPPQTYKRKTPTGVRTKRLANRPRVDQGISINEPTQSPPPAQAPQTVRAARGQTLPPRKGKTVAGTSQSAPPPPPQPQGFQVRRKPEMFRPARSQRMVRKPFNYKGRASKVREAREQNPKREERFSTDGRFWTFFQQDFYETVILTRKNPVIPMQWVDWEYMAEANDAVFDEVIEACERTKIKTIMSFRHDWNTEVIAQFYATLYVSKARISIMHWMTEGQWYEISYTQFARALGFSEEDARDRDEIHNEVALTSENISFLYEEDSEFEPGSTKGMKPFFVCLNRLFRKTLAPKEGDASHVLSFTRNLLSRMREGQRLFDVFDFIWNEIRLTAQEPKRSCGYAPFIMHVIETVTELQFEHDVQHSGVQIRVLKAPQPSQRARRTTAGASSSSAAAPAAVSGDSSSSSSVLRALKSIFGICKSNAKRIKQIQRHLNLPCSDDEEFEDPFAPEDEDSESVSDEDSSEESD